jgi:hypothetical protein
MVVANHRRLTLRIRIGLEYINTVIRPKRSIYEINNAENESVNLQFLHTLQLDPRKVNYKRHLCSQDNNCDIFALVLSDCCTGRFIMFSAITNIYNKKTEGPTLKELFTATGKVIFFN